ncbi:response regulator transcription factor [Ruminococcus sp.]|uniref:response regulator transcription factor n=1 Tax=Ruminococcus sp. TaxID=41978 RepID=UPI0026010553|nr:response regulator transcription factor [Ruminococcus sp.]MBQ8966286.1 response regulator transcription factor [Ruminococcus sp.]
MRKILVLEDDENIRLGLCHILKVNGYEPAAAGRLAEARALYAGCSLCLLDVMLPDGSGVDFCREIRKSSDVPVIFLTCVDDSTRIAGALDVGGDDYVIKPFDTTVLLARIKAALRRCGAEELPEDLDLTAIERELAEYFRMNKNRILTREQILAKLWDSRGEYVNDNTLSVRINRLRAKLEKAGNGRIVTVKGVGYKWEER